MLRLSLAAYAPAPFAHASCMMVPDGSQNLAARVPPFATEDLHGEGAKTRRPFRHGRPKRAVFAAMLRPVARPLSPLGATWENTRAPRHRTQPDLQGVPGTHHCGKNSEFDPHLIRIPPSNHRRRAPTCAVSRADPLAVGQMGDLLAKGADSSKGQPPSGQPAPAKSKMTENAIECAVRRPDPRPSRALIAQNAWSRNSRARFRARRVRIRPRFQSPAVWAGCFLKVWAGFLRKTSWRHGGGSTRAVARVVCRRIGHRDHQLADGTAAGSKRARLRLDAQLERLGEPQRALRVEPLVEAALCPTRSQTPER